MDAKKGRKRAGAVRGMRWAAALAATAILAALPACSSVPSKVTGSGPRFTDVVAEASLVYVQVNWRGYLVLDRNVDLSGNEYLAKGVYGPYRAVTSCSGFLASGSGDVVTAGHCVDATSIYGGKGAILAVFMTRLTHPGGVHLSPAEQSSWAEILAANASVEGLESGSPVDRTVRVTAASGHSGTHMANVVDVQPFKEGDVALLRANGLTGLMLPLAAAAPQNGDSIIAAGYQGDVAQVVDSAKPAAFVEGTVSGTQTVNGTPFTQVSADTSAGMSGGPVLNMAGQVVGTVSWAPSGTSAAHFITDLGSVRSMLAGNGVRTTLTAGDRAFRQGMAYYFASRYHEAVQQFNRTLQAQPGQELAAKYRQQAVARYPQDVNPPSSGLPVWAYAAIGAAVLILGGAAGFFLMRRRRAGPSGGLPAAPAPGPVAPPEARPEMPVSGGAPAEPVPAGQPGPPAPGPAVPTAQATEEAPLFCPNCGTRHPPEAHYCEHCGQPFSVALPTEPGSDRGART